MPLPNWVPFQLPGELGGEEGLGEQAGKLRLTLIVPNSHITLTGTRGHRERTGLWLPTFVAQTSIVLVMWLPLCLHFPSPNGDSTHIRRVVGDVIVPRHSTAKLWEIFPRGVKPRAS